MASFFKNFEFFHSGVRQTKNIMVRCPLFSLIEKIFKTCHEWDSNPRPKMQSNLDNCSINWAIKNSKRNWWCNFNQCKSNQTQLNPSNLNLTSRTEWMNSYLGDIFRQLLVISSVCVVAINFKFFEAFIILVVFFWSNWCKSHFLYSHFRSLWCPMLALQVWNKS